MVTSTPNDPVLQRFRAAVAEIYGAQRIWPDYMRPKESSRNKCFICGHKLLHGEEAAVAAVSNHEGAL